MKKLVTIIALSGVMFFAAQNANAQAASQLNFGLIGVSYEIPIASAISIAPAAGTDINLDYLILGVRANFYFDDMIGLPSEWDVYGGANAGFGLGLNNQANDLEIGLHVGGRWFWNDKWGVYLEAGGGKLSGAGGGIGLTMKM